jgi:hypothetical protein
MTTGCEQFDFLWFHPEKLKPMKWTTFLFLALLYNGFAQHTVAFLETPADALLPPGSARSDALTSSLEVVHNLAFVTARLDNREGRFLLDTGAPLLVLNRPADGNQTAAAVTSINGTFEMFYTQVEHFRWQHLHYKKLAALQSDIHHLEQSTNRTIQGMIGYDLLKNYEVFVNYPDRQLLLLPPAKNKLHIAAEPLATLPFELQDHLPVITVQVDGHTLRLGLDTGAGANLLDASYASILETQAAAEETITAMDRKSQTLERILLPATEVGAVQLPYLPYLLADLSHLRAATTLRMDGLLGYPFFSRVKCSIDYVNRKVHIWWVSK